MGISDRGTKAKTITSCDNAFVTNILSLTLRLHYAFAQKTFVAPRPCCEAKRLIGRPQESAQPERKSTSRYGEMPFLDSPL
ncbi:hypothetical protein [Lysinibacillus sp. RS5]|uniref:hypothetical protein n=1 Tax=unclassified Lysinibacillus TaxID=2636778 RepID=UPI0035BE2C45